MTADTPETTAQYEAAYRGGRDAVLSIVSGAMWAVLGVFGAGLDDCHRTHQRQHVTAYIRRRSLRSRTNRSCRRRTLPPPTRGHSGVLTEFVSPLGLRRSNGGGERIGEYTDSVLQHSSTSTNENWVLLGTAPLRIAGAWRRGKTGQLRMPR